MKKLIVMMLWQAIQLNAYNAQHLGVDTFDALVMVPKNEREKTIRVKENTYQPLAWEDWRVSEKDEDDCYDAGDTQIMRNLMRRENTQNAIEAEVVLIQAIKTEDGDYDADPRYDCPPNILLESARSSHAYAFELLRVLLHTRKENGGSVLTVETEIKSQSDFENIEIADDIRENSDGSGKQGQEATITFQDKRKEVQKTVRGWCDLWRVHYTTVSEYSAKYSWEKVGEFSEQHKVAVQKDAREKALQKKELTKKGKRIFKQGAACAVLAACACVAWWFKKS